MAQNLKALETERLFLRGIDNSDTELIVQWRSAPDVYKYFRFPHQLTIEEHMNWYYTRYLADRNRFDWVCIEKKSGSRIGIFGLYRIDDKAEINYLLAPQAQHKGYAAEAIHELIRFAKINWNSKLVFAEIHEENKPSIALAAKLGLERISQDGSFVVYGIEV